MPRYSMAITFFIFPLTGSDKNHRIHSIETFSKRVPMKKADYSLVYLDADDTLFDYARAERFALEEAFAAFSGIGASPLDGELLKSYGEINKKLWRDYENKLISQEHLRTERFKLLFEKHDIDIDALEFGVGYLSRLGKASFLVDGALALCEYLHARYTVAIITNGIAEVQRARIGGSSIKGYIDHLIISEEAGYGKPDVGIFSYAETITGSRDKSRMIIVGDSPQSDVQGGINYGIDTCWFNIHGIENTTGIQPKYTIGKLEELKSILESGVSS